MRRRLALALLGATALAGCVTSAPSAAAWAQDASVLAQGLSNIVPQLAGMTGVPADVASKAQAALSAAAALARQLSGVTTAAQGQSEVQVIEGYVNTALSALQPYYSLLPAPLGTALTAVTLLLPFIETAVGMIAANVSASAVRKPMLVRTPAPQAAPASDAHAWAVSVLRK